MKNHPCQTILKRPVIKTDRFVVICHRIYLLVLPPISGLEPIEKQICVHSLQAPSIACKLHHRDRYLHVCPSYTPLPACKLQTHSEIDFVIASTTSATLLAAIFWNSSNDIAPSSSALSEMHLTLTNGLSLIEQV